MSSGLKSTAPGFVTRCLETLAAAVCVGILSGMVDVALAVTFGGSIDRQDGLVILLTHLAFGFGAGLVLMPIAASMSIWRIGTRTPSPAHPLTLVYLAAFGVLFVIVNRPTFQGAGLERSGYRMPVEVGATVIAGLSAFAVIVHSSRLVHRRARDGGRAAATATLALLSAGALHAADRLFLRAQYPAVHDQVFVAAWCLVLTGVTWMRRPSAARTSLSRRIVIGFGLLATTTFVVVVPTGRLDAALARAINEPAIGVRRIVAVAAPIIQRLRSAARSEAPDVSEYFAASQPDRTLVKETAGHLLGGARPNVVLMSIDTVRADHVGFLGYRRHPTTPNWDAHAAKAAVFTAAYTPYPTSSYAFSGLFNSRYAEECPQRIVDLRRSADGSGGVRSLASVLSNAGYATAAVTAVEPAQVAPGAPFSTFPDGFETFAAEGVPHREADAATLIEKALARLDELAAGNKPFFLWVHVFDPHHPYRPRPGIDFGSSKTDLYDAEIAWADRALGRLIERLGRSDLAATTMTIVHADHGEAFGDHGTDFHSSSVYEEQIRIPLTVSIPGVAAARHDEVISLVDLLPSVLAIVDVDDPDAPRRRGRDVADLLLGLRASGSTSAKAFTQLLLGDLFSAQTKDAVVSGKWKLIRHVGGILPIELYDLHADPRETRSVAGEHRSEAARLEAVVRHIAERIERP